MSFSDALMRARRALDDAGYAGARIEVHLVGEDVHRAEREFRIAIAVVDQAIRPVADLPRCLRLLGVVHKIPVYVVDNP